MFSVGSLLLKGVLIKKGKKQRGSVFVQRGFFQQSIKEVQNICHDSFFKYLVKHYVDQLNKLRPCPLDVYHGNKDVVFWDTFEVANRKGIFRGKKGGGGGGKQWKLVGQMKKYIILTFPKRSKPFKLRNMNTYVNHIWYI